MSWLQFQERETSFTSESTTHDYNFPERKKNLTWKTFAVQDHELICTSYLHICPVLVLYIHTVHQWEDGNRFTWCFYGIHTSGVVSYPDRGVNSDFSTPGWKAAIGTRSSIARKISGWAGYLKRAFYFCQLKKSRVFLAWHFDNSPFNVLITVKILRQWVKLNLKLILCVYILLWIFVVLDGHVQDFIQEERKIWTSYSDKKYVNFLTSRSMITPKS